jgi:hypothetical protein
MRTLVWVLLSLAPLSQQQPPRDTSLSTSGTAIVRGHVIAGDTGAPIPEAFIILSSDDDHPSSYTHTDERGQFEIRSVVPGVYHLQVLPPEYRSRYLGRVFGGEDVWGHGRAIEIAAGEVRDGIDVVLPASAAVSGRVLDEAGEPLARVSVRAIRVLANGGRSDPVGNGTLQTDDLGRFRLFGLPEGDYLLEATPEPIYMRAKDSSSPAFVATFYPSVPSSDGAVKIRVKAGQDADGFDILLVRTKTFRVSGTVLDPDGQPWRNAMAGLTRFQGGGEELRVDSAGRFAIAGLVPGTYQISVRPPADGRNGYGTTRFTVADANVENLVVLTSPAVDVRGRVVLDGGTPSNLSKFSVEVTQIDPDGQFQWIPMRVSVNPDGSFLMPKLHGPSVVRARPPDDWHLKAVLLDGEDITDRPTEFRARDSEHLQVVLTNRGATIDGTVSDDRGDVVSDCVVLLFPANRADWKELSSRSDQRSPGRGSRFRFDGLRAGRYLLAAVPFDRVDGIDTTSAAVRESLANAATEIVLGEDEQRTINLTLLKGGGDE